MALFSQSSGFASEVDLIEEEQLDPVEAVEQEVMEAESTFRAEVETMSEVRIRMQKAKYYEALLQAPLFGNDQRPLALEVEAEVREFVMEQLCTFLGMKTDGTRKSQVADVFDDEQVGALTMLANRVLKRPLLAGPQGQRREEGPPQVSVATLREEPQVAPRQQLAPLPTSRPQPQRQPAAPAQRKPRQPPGADGAPKMIPHPLTGKPVPVSSLEQAKPVGVKPQEMPTSGNFVNSGGGGFVDMTGGAATQTVAAQAVGQGSVGSGISNPAVHGQLIDYFLRKK